MTGIAQLRFAASILFGVRFARWSLDTLIDAMQSTLHEFGSLSCAHHELMGPVLDDETRREFQGRRFRKQAVRAMRETAYYRDLFGRLDLDPATLRFDDIARLPLTPKEAVRGDAEAFIRSSQRPIFRSTTTGTTGWPTSIAFSEYELRVSIAMFVLGGLNSGTFGPGDIVQISTSSRAHLGNLCAAGAYARLGALVHMPGQLDPALTLALLRERHHLPGRKAQVSILGAYPSYLGELIEVGRRLGYGPEGFGVERITSGGELVTAGLKRRAQAFFGPVPIEDGFGMTELWPFGGMPCSDGHLHWEPAAGLMEVVDLDTKAPAAPGSLGTLVLTPFPPFRETTILLRYDTEDVVRTLDGPLTCSLRHLPATSHLLGKRRLSVKHDRGWTFPRDVLEAVEAVDEIPLPGRCGFWAVPGGVAVEVVVLQETRSVRCRLEDELEMRGVPVRALHLVPDRRELRHPLPLRGDLRELSFDDMPGLHARRVSISPLAATDETMPEGKVVL
jgi:phenylacetate-CoA ligase